MVTRAYNPDTWEAEAGESEVQGHSLMHKESETGQVT